MELRTDDLRNSHHLIYSINFSNGTFMRILIADGNDVLLDLLESFLRDRGHTVTTARNGLECAMELRRFVPDVMLLERNLLWGGSDGIIALMRDQLGAATPPVILMTDRHEAAHDDDSSPSRGVESLTKPFRLGALTRALAKVTESAYATPSYDTSVCGRYDSSLSTS